MQQQLRAQAGYEISPKMQADPAFEAFQCEANVNSTVFICR